MTLLITVFAAIIATVVWYVREESSTLKVGMLVWMYWGASIMWLVDAIFEYVDCLQKETDYFRPEISDMVNDAFLGLSVVALGLIVWLVVLLIKDPKGRVRGALLKKKK